jgi:hypothetical protein
VEQGAGLLHRDQDLVVAADPGQVVGPAATVYMKAAVLAPQLLDDAGEPVGAVAGCQLLPDAARWWRYRNQSPGRRPLVGCSHRR